MSALIFAVDKPRAVADPVVDFGKAQALHLLVHALKKALQTKAINAEFAFMSRTELGLYSLLHQLKARVNVRAPWQRCDC